MCFLPLAFSKQCPWSWMSMVPAHCSPVICAQLESRRPQTGARSSDTAGVESHNPAWRTSVHAGWCRCLAPSSADGPVDLPWMSSSPFKCAQTPWMVVSVFASWVGLTLRAGLCPSLLYRCHRWGEDRVGSQTGRGLQWTGEVKRADSSNPKQICNVRAVAAAEIQTETRLKGTWNLILILCVWLWWAMYRVYCLPLPYTKCRGNKHFT